GPGDDGVLALLIADVVDAPVRRHGALLSRQIDDRWSLNKGPSVGCQAKYGLFVAGRQAGAHRDGDVGPRTAMSVPRLHAGLLVGRQARGGRWPGGYGPAPFLRRRGAWWGWARWPRRSRPGRGTAPRGRRRSAP